MINLRTQIELDLADTVEAEFKMPVQLTGPDGITQVYKKDSITDLLGGQVLYTTRRVNPETGEVIIVNEPVVTLRISSLNRVPQNGERWYIKFPVSPVVGATYQSFTFTPTRATEGGQDIGIIKIYPQRIEQDTEDQSS